MHGFVRNFYLESITCLQQNQLLTNSQENGRVTIVCEFD